MNSIDDYRQHVGDKVLYSIFKKARKLYGKTVAHINSTYIGGGVAEILTSLIPLMNEIGIDTGWRLLHGNPDFFNITKKFHNALQGDQINFSEMKKRLYLQANENVSKFTHLEHDFIIVHDPQPLPLIKFYRKKQPWIWRCHIDCSHADPNLIDFFRNFVIKYDMLIFSHEDYLKKDIPVEHRIFAPAIDPLTSKNMDINDAIMTKTIRKFKIPTDKPLITQISRFDKWKDPIGVVEAFKIVRKKIDCRLVLCGNMATDDPEGFSILEQVRKKANHLIENNDVIIITDESMILVNVLQRISDIIIQKSLREGFGLTVTEALWKARPVVASNVGGIPLQVIDGKTGFLVGPNDIQGCADRTVELLKNPNLAEKMGLAGREHVRKNFLMTRLLSDYLDLLHYLSA